MNKQTEQPPSQTPQKQVSLADITIDNENTALNVMVGMLNSAQRRGAFSMEESSKCWECVNMFMKKEQSQQAVTNPTSGHNEVV